MMNTTDVKHGNDMLGRARGLVLEAKRVAYDTGDLAACGAIDAAFGALSECRLVEPGQGRIGQPPRPATAQDRPRPSTPAERYLMDAHFHVLVDFMRGTLAEGNFTGSEIREAAMLAAQIHEAQTIRPLFWNGKDLR